MIHATDADTARFMKYVEKLPNGCWFWSGARSRGKGNRKWYGSFRVGRRVVRAHVYSCDVIKKVECPPDHERDHNCVFTLCVNPEHLDIIPREEHRERKKDRKNGHGR